VKAPRSSALRPRLARRAAASRSWRPRKARSPPPRSSSTGCTPRRRRAAPRRPPWMPARCRARPGSCPTPRRPHVRAANGPPAAAAASSFRALDSASSSFSVRAQSSARSASTSHSHSVFPADRAVRPTGRAPRRAEPELARTDRADEMHQRVTDTHAPRRRGFDGAGIASSDSSWVWGGSGQRAARRQSVSKPARGDRRRPGPRALRCPPASDLPGNPQAADP
jgi:hypothetical protein